MIYVGFIVLPLRFILNGVDYIKSYINLEKVNMLKMVNHHIRELGISFHLFKSTVRSPNLLSSYWIYTLFDVRVTWRYFTALENEILSRYTPYFLPTHSRATGFCGRALVISHLIGHTFPLRILACDPPNSGGLSPGFVISVLFWFVASPWGWNCHLHV